MKKLTIFTILFVIMNLAFIPLMALYGLSICPVLRVPGFWVGCAYAGSYVAAVLVINFIFLVFSRKRKPLFYACIYLFASILALIVLEFVFGLNHISTESRAPEILLVTSLLLGVTQTYGLSWVFDSHQTLKKEKTFNQSWLHHSLRTMTPVILGVLVLLHFLFIQEFLQHKPGFIPDTSEEIITQTQIIISFVICWMLITYLFHFLSERENAVKVGLHLQRLEEGNYVHNSDLSGSWGLWRSIMQQLNDFAKIFGERNRILNSFSRFVSKDVVQGALQTEINSTSGVEQEMTVIMTDIRSFTSLSEKYSAQTIVEILNEYFNTMLDELVKHQITIDKFIGDGILAYVEPSLGNNQEQAVKASMAMLSRLEELNKKFKAKNLPDLQIGIGIYHGKLIKGLIGSHERLQHTIIGDTVNKAARLESLNKELKTDIIINNEVWNHLTPETQKRFILHSGVKLHGASELIDVYALKNII